MPSNSSVKIFLKLPANGIAVIHLTADLHLKTMGNLIL